MILHFLKLAKQTIFFEAGGNLHLYNIASGTMSKVTIQIISDQKELIPEIKNVENYAQYATYSLDPS